MRPWGLESSKAREAVRLAGALDADMDTTVPQNRPVGRDGLHGPEEDPWRAWLDPGRLLLTAGR